MCPIIYLQEQQQKNLLVPAFPCHFGKRLLKAAWDSGKLWRGAPIPPPPRPRLATKSPQLKLIGAFPCHYLFHTARRKRISHFTWDRKAFPAESVSRFMQWDGRTFPFCKVMCQGVSLQLSTAHGLWLFNWGGGEGRGGTEFLFTTQVYSGAENRS